MVYRLEVLLELVLCENHMGVSPVEIWFVIVDFIFNGSENAKVMPGSFQRPEQVRVGIWRGDHEAAIREDHTSL